MNIEDAYEEYQSLMEGLEGIGLTTYQARAFLALVILGVGSAEVVAENAKIPRTSAYKVLESLEKMGFVVAAEGRPKIYKPVELREIKDRIIDNVTELFDKLEFIQEFLREKGEPQLVYTVYGKDNVLRKIGEMIDLTEEEIILSTPVFSEIRKNLGKHLEQALSRGVRVIIITSPNQKVLKNAEVHRRKGLIATDIVSDNKRALLASPELNACGYTSNPSLAQHLTHFINIMIDKN
ncbi:MAG: TrmB family transcriptional regulator [Euryarchaeota archaeon]|nr:TrmB family transcriptional regulator [Euryarchaeota archaeon]